MQTAKDLRSKNSAGSQTQAELACAMVVLRAPAPAGGAGEDPRRARRSETFGQKLGGVADPRRARDARRAVEKWIRI
jgi:hypothetical protein